MYTLEKAIRSESSAAAATSASRRVRGQGADQMSAPRPNTSGASVACPDGKAYQPPAAHEARDDMGPGPPEEELEQAVERPAAQRRAGIAGRFGAPPDRREPAAQQQRQRNLDVPRAQEARGAHDAGRPGRPMRGQRQHQPDVQRLAPPHQDGHREYGEQDEAHECEHGRQRARVPPSAAGRCRRGLGGPAHRGARDRSPHPGWRSTPGARTCAAPPRCSAARAAARRRAAGPARPRPRRRRAAARSASMVIGSPSSTSAIGPPTAASGATWPTTSPYVPPEKRPSVISADRVAEPGADDGRRRGEHLPHPGAAARALVADDHHVARPDPPGQNRLQARLFRLEDPGRAGDPRLLDAGDLRDRSLGRQVAPQHRQVPLGVERLPPGPDHVLVGARLGRQVAPGSRRWSGR